MNCFIEVKRVEKCVACSRPFHSHDNATSVRVQDSMGYSIALMCDSCMDSYAEYRRRKETLLSVV
jgi:hypothetical protein